MQHYQCKEEFLIQYQIDPTSRLNRPSILYIFHLKVLKSFCAQNHSIDKFAL